MFVLGVKIKTSYLVTLMPHDFVAMSNVLRTSTAIISRSDKISERVLVPRTFLRVEAANRFVLNAKFATLHTADVGCRTLYKKIIAKVEWVNYSSGLGTKHFKCQYSETWL